MTDAATKESRRQSRRSDRLCYPNNTARILLMKQTKPDTLTPRIQALPQELQDEIRAYTLLIARQREYWIGRQILEKAREIPLLASRPRHGANTLRLERLVHHARELFRNPNPDYVESLRGLVRVFATDEITTIFFLRQLISYPISAKSSLLEEAAVLRIVMLACECTKLRSTSLGLGYVCRLVQPRFKSFEYLRWNLCMQDMPTFLTATVKQPYLGKGYPCIPSSPSHWYMDMHGADPEHRAIISVEGDKSYTWLSLHGGGWCFTTNTPSIKELDLTGSYGIVEWQVEGRSPVRIDYLHRRAGTFNKYCEKFDPKGAREVERLRAEHARRDLEEFWALREWRHG